VDAEGSRGANVTATSEGEGSPSAVAVVGLGLMGGSLCRALRTTASPPRILGSDTDLAQGSRALDAGAVDLFDPSAESIVGEADVVVYAAPLGTTLELVRAHAPIWKENALITDMVSLKASLVRSAEAGGFASRFVGAHPICGGEASGFTASRGDLFSGATIWLCASPEASQSVRARAEAFWRSVSGVPQWSEAAEHDRRMAWVSHLPQLVANALAGALDAAGYSPDELGPGGRDMTRLAGSNPEIWRDLLQASAPVTGTGLTSVSNALNILADLLARREVDRIAEFMARTRSWREGAA